MKLFLHLTLGVSYLPLHGAPHERDESANSQQSRNTSTAQVGQQAFEHVDSGQVDTDKGSVTPRVYEGLKHKP